MRVHLGGEAAKKVSMLQGIAKKTCDVLPMISHFHSAVVEVGDFEAGVGDYARLLGQKPGWIGADEKARTRSALFPLANMRLEIRGRASGTESESNGLVGIRLGCDELEGAIEELASRGIGAGAIASEESPGPDGESTCRWHTTPIDPKASRSIHVELISDETDSGWLDAATEDPRSAIRALDHVVVFSPDVEATRDFYGDGLGIRLALDRSFEKRGVRLVFFRVGGVTIEIGSRLGATPEPDAADRFGGLAWQVQDIDAIHSRLEADRFDVSGIRDGNKPGTRVCTVRDPVHGVPTLLIEPVS
jgi:catechol 2,3-dioxygenase-like lactoylglutathione lyase family enzyme